MTEKRFLAIDYGLKRIGLAVSDPMGIIATGIGTIKNSENIISDIFKIIQKYNPIKIIIGKPINLKGEETEQTKEVFFFVDKLKEKTNIQIEYLDERFTSKIAKDTLLEVGLNKKKRAQKERLDEISAIIILQNFLDLNSKNL